VSKKSGPVKISCHFLKRPLKRRILTLFLGFYGQISLKKNSKQLVSTKLDKGFRLVYELNYMDEKKISTFFWQGSHLMVKID
jgi:hypothetical protein